MSGTQSDTLFTDEILIKLEAREKELREGGGFEVADTAELRKRMEALKASAAAKAA